MTEVLEGEIVEEDELSNHRSAITPKAQVLILESVRDGASLSAAARLAKIVPMTLIAALQTAEKSKGHRLHRFTLELRQAEATVEEQDRKEWLAMVRDKGDPKSFRDYMERKHADWAPVARVPQSNMTVVNFSDRMAELFATSTDPSKALPTGD